MFDRIMQLADRTLVLFVGVAMGVLMGLAFANDGDPLAGSNAMAAPMASEKGDVGENDKIAGAKQEAKQKVCRTKPQLSRSFVADLKAGRQVDIGVFGDSFGEGVWAGIYNDLRSEPNVAVHKFGKQSTGFTRYSSLNLYSDARSKLDRQPIDLAVISFGANDTQPLFADGRGQSYMSDDWKKTVSDRASKMVQLIRDRGATVVWVGLPKMRKASYDEQITQMNEFYKDLMCDLDVAFIDTVPMSLSSKGGYDAYMRDPKTGERVKARAGDGIHMTMRAYSFLVHDLTKQIKGYAGSARVKAKAGTKTDQSESGQ